ncbi:TPA: hypothetical protein HA241_01580 [Candidatus Woesearchaeota archaeon]|nr:hypothetical protein [Candidatus Woesearchaeota archaeon]
MTEPLLIATHGEDPDGIIAHALLLSVYSTSEPLDPKNHVFVRYDRLGEQMEGFVRRAEEVRPRQIVIADIGPNQRFVEHGGSRLSLVHRLRDTGGVVHWYDHHVQTEQIQRKLEALQVHVYYSATQCAAMQIHRRFSSRTNGELAKIAQAHDYRSGSHNKSQRFEKGDILEKLICLAQAEQDSKKLLRLADDLRKGLVFSNETTLFPMWDGEVTQYGHRSRGAYACLDQSVQSADIAGIRFLFAYADPILSQKPATRHLKAKYGSTVDVIVTIFAPPARNYIVDGMNERFDVIPFVETVGGGGRGNMGGFTVDEDVKPEEFQTYIASLQEQIRSYIHSRSA